MLWWTTVRRMKWGSVASVSRVRIIYSTIVKTQMAQTQKTQTQNITTKWWTKLYEKQRKYSWGYLSNIIFSMATTKYYNLINEFRVIVELTFMHHDYFQHMTTYKRLFNQDMLDMMWIHTGNLNSIRYNRRRCKMRHGVADYVSPHL